MLKYISRFRVSLVQPTECVRACECVLFRVPFRSFLLRVRVCEEGEGGWGASEGNARFSQSMLFSPSGSLAICYVSVCVCVFERVAVG